MFCQKLSPVGATITPSVDTAMFSTFVTTLTTPVDTAMTTVAATSVTPTVDTAQQSFLVPAVITVGVLVVVLVVVVVIIIVVVCVPRKNKIESMKGNHWYIQ